MHSPLLSICFSLVILAGYWTPTIGGTVLGNKVEAILTFASLAFAIILTAIITGPGHGLAVDEDGAISFGNEYYFAWLALFSCFVLVQNLVSNLFGVNVVEGIQNRSKSFSYWMALMFCSLVVMGSSSEFHGRKCMNDDVNNAACSRSVFGVVVGIVGVLFSGGIVMMKITHGLASPFIIEVAVCVWLFLLYVFEVGFITGNNGPGAPLGNLYYFSWISFLLTIAIANACHEDYTDAQMPHQPVPGSTEMPTLEQVENQTYEDSVEGAGVGDAIVKDIENDEAELASSDNVGVGSLRKGRVDP